jgi:hypothetical protein
VIDVLSKIIIAYPGFLVTKAEHKSIKDIGLATAVRANDRSESQKRANVHLSF